MPACVYYMKKQALLSTHKAFSPFEVQNDGHELLF